MNPVTATLVGLLMALLAMPVWALQSTGAPEGSLADQAEKVKRERAARRAAGKRSKSFTNDHLGPSSGVAASTSSEAGTPAAEGAAPADTPAKPEKTDDERRADKRAEIQKKIDEQKQRIEVINRVTADAQRELSNISTYNYGTRRATLQKAVDDGKVEMARTQQALADLEEEARRIGVSVSR
jgi:hypothetical protein